MYNDHIMRFETLNGQNSRGWLINSGAHYIWDEDNDHYTDGFMLTADMKRVPGVTAENKEMPVLSTLTSAMQYPENNYANGLSFNNMYTVAGFEVDNYDSELTARKSYFLFDNELVMLGSKISLSNSSNNVETTVDQRMLRLNDVDGISVNGTNLNSEIVSNQAFENTSYVHLKGRTTNSQFGYFFPDSPTVKVDKRTTTNRRADVDWYTYKDESTETQTLGTVYLDHGQNPTNAKYKYVILPGMSEEETRNYSNNPQIEVLAQTDSYHAVKETGLGISALVNFDNAPVSAGGITVDKKSMSVNTLLPYQIQDAYNRKRTTKKFKAAILENDYLKAVFLPELGGRLWSLYNKKEQKELLYVNDVFQPCNLALRNAWFSGGVEWNVGIKGHNPLTCSPMFAKKVYNDKGDEILRMYEFERIREIPYRIDALLKEDTLLVKVTIENTTENDKYMYWWSNIAVPETDNVRVIVPANEVYQCSYNEGSYVLDKSSMPVLNGCDCSKPSNIKRSMDFFYDIKEDEKKWIASLYEDGKGLLHISTNELIGRKLFVWGQGKGGRNWNKWLSDSDVPYIEIQAGLLKTQLEHFVMDKCSEISFVEGYTMASTDPEITLGDNWDAAVNAVKKDVDSHIDYVYENLWNVVKEDELKCVGSGWGALENIIREKEGKEKISKTLDFPESSLNCEQESWLKLIDDGVLYEEDELMPPKSYTTSPYLFDLLVSSKENKKSENWYAYMQLGIMKYAKGDIDGAFLDFEKSVSLKANPWSLRNLAMIYAKEKNDLILAEEYIIKAINLKPDYRGLAVNCAEILVNNENYNKWLKIYNSLNDSLKEDGRLKMMSAICYIRCGLLDNAKEIINENFVMNDIKEGEFAISKVWVEMYKEIMKKEGKDCDNMTDEEVFKLYPLPSKIDFRMHE